MKSSKHVVWIIMDFYPVYTGHGVYLQQLAPFLEKHGYHFTVITGKQNNVVGEENIGNLTVKRLKYRNDNTVGFIKFCIAACNYLFKMRKEFTIIHLHGVFDRFAIFGIFSKCFKKQLIFQMVLMGSDDPFSCIGSHRYQWLRSKIFLLFDMIITISTPLTKLCMEFKIKPAKITQIMQGIDTKLFFPIESQNMKLKLRALLGFDFDKKIAIFVGAIIERKGVYELLSIWSEIQEQLDNVILVMVGPDEFQYPHYQNYVNQMKLFVKNNNMAVVFTGKVDNVNDYLRASDIFVFSSKNEGFGNVIIEAMGCGLPCVVTEMGGVAYDTVINEKTGFIVSNMTEFKAKVSDLLVNGSKASEMGIRGRERVKCFFDIRFIAQQYISLYGMLDR